MSGSPVRRLVLDISPWAWAYILFIVGCSLIMNYAWASNGPPYLMTGFFFGLASSLAQQKVAIWRLLPVSRVEIDRARWWLAPGAGLIGLPLLMVLPALARMLQHRPHLGWDQIALGSLAQIGVCAIYALFLITLPWAGRQMGRWSAIFFLFFMLLILRLINLPHDPAAAQRVVAVLAAAGLPIALALYLAAGRWPTPLIGSFWSIVSSGKHRDVPAASHRVKGWPALAMGAWPMLAIYVAASTAYPILILLIAPRMNLAAMTGVIVFIGLQVMMVGILPAIRILRALPLTGWQLVMRLCALLAFIQLSSLVSFVLSVLILQPQHMAGVLRALPVLPLSLFFIPGGLRFGPRAALFGGGLVYLLAQSFLFLSADTPASVLLAACIIAATASLLWLWWEITHGHHAYRMVPLAPMRWRGV